MPFTVACKCGQRFMAEDYLEGHRVPCSMCGTVLLVQRTTGVFLTPNPSQIVSCRCGMSFQAAAFLAGKRVACPNCQSPIDVPITPTRVAPAQPNYGAAHRVSPQIVRPKQTSKDKRWMLVGTTVLGLLVIGGVGFAIHSFYAKRGTEVAESKIESVTTEVHEPAASPAAPVKSEGVPRSKPKPTSTETASGPTIPFKDIFPEKSGANLPSTDSKQTTSPSAPVASTVASVPASSSTTSTAATRLSGVAATSVAAKPIKPGLLAFDNWQEKRAPDSTFSVQVPNGLVQKSPAVKLPPGSQAMHFEDPDGTKLYLTMSLQLPGEIAASRARAFLRESADKVPLMLRNLLSEREFTHRGYPALERTQSGEINGTAMQSITRFILVRDTLIIVSTASSLTDFNRPRADRFLDSLQFGSGGDATFALEQGVLEWHSSNANLRGAIASATSEDIVELKYSWLSKLLPHIGRQKLYDRIRFADPWTDDKNVEVASTTVSEFLNPADPRDKYSGLKFEGLAVTHFVGVSGVEDKRNVIAARLPRSDPRAGIFGYDEVASASSITDGLSHTAMMLGSGELTGPWMIGGGSTIRGAREPHFDRLSGFGSQGTPKRGALAVMADGSVRFVPATTDSKIFRAMCTTHAADSFDLENVTERSSLRGGAHAP